MGGFVADKAAELLRARNVPVSGARVGVLGLTFKENVPDLRNSRVPDITDQLRAHGIDPMVHDPLASAEEALGEYGIELRPIDALSELDVLILAVAHRPYLDDLAGLCSRLKTGGLLIDVKSAFDPEALRSDLLYWSL